MGRKVCFIELPSPSFVTLNAKKLVPGAWINLPVLRCVWTHATLITYSCLENHISKRTVQHKFHLCFDSPLTLIGYLFPTEVSILLWFIKQVGPHLTLVLEYVKLVLAIKKDLVFLLVINKAFQGKSGFIAKRLFQ